MAALGALGSSAGALSDIQSPRNQYGRDEDRSCHSSESEAYADNQPPVPVGARETAELLFENPEGFDAMFFPGVCCGPAKSVNGTTVLVIVLSQVQLCVESMPAFYQAAQDLEQPWFGLEIGVVAWFTVEYLARFWASGNRCAFLRGALNACDLIAILPFYIELAQGGQAVNFKMFRLFRVVRVLKVSRFLAGIRTIWRALDETRSQLLMGLCLLIISIFLWSTALFYVEREWSEWDDVNHLWVYRTEVLNVTLSDNGSERFELVDVVQLSMFQSIPHSFWWCITTLTTVGYGDAVPQSPPGKVFAGLTMVTGVFVLALPTSIIGSKFLDLYKEEELRERLRDQRDETERRDADMTELLVLVSDLASAGHLTTATTAVGDDFSLDPLPGQAEEILAAAFAEAYYPRVRAIFQASMMAPVEEVRRDRFVRNILEFLRQKRFFEQRRIDELRASKEELPPDLQAVLPALRQASIARAGSTTSAAASMAGASRAAEQAAAAGGTPPGAALAPQRPADPAPLGAGRPAARRGSAYSLAPARDSARAGRPRQRTVVG